MILPSRLLAIAYLWTDLRSHNVYYAADWKAAQLHGSTLVHSRCCAELNEHLK
ncbi:hypothetical protein ES703_44682 [subsurface metagenome]